MKKRILAVILSAMMMTSSFPVNAAELEVVYVNEETTDDQPENYDGDVTDIVSDSTEEEPSDSEGVETEIKENEVTDDAEKNDEDFLDTETDKDKYDETPEEFDGDGDYPVVETGTDLIDDDDETELLSEAEDKGDITDPSDAAESEYYFTDEWLKEHGLTVNDEGMFEYVDENGELWIYNPEDPEFWKYFVETDREYVGLSENIEEETLLTSGEKTYTDPFTCTITGKKYRYPSYYKTSSDAERVPVRYGIDVSYHQGKISASGWQAMKDEYDVDFAFIRAGFRGYGQSGSLNPDDKFSTNIRNACNAGIKTGVYFFSQAISESEARDEADYCLKLIGSDIDLVTLPIIIDYEYSGNPGRLKGANLSASKHTAIVNAFCNRIREKGHTAGIYANKSMFTDDMVFSSIDSENFIWMAHWPSSSGGVYSTSFGQRLNCWQFTDAFTGFGTKGCGYMGNDVLDLDFWFGAFPGEVFTGELKYDANGGSGDEDAQIGKIGDTVELEECPYKKEGCTFKEWNTKANGYGTSYHPGDKYTISGRTQKLFAIWEYNEYVLTFDPRGGEVSASEKTVLFDGKPYGELPIADREGFLFLGWFDEADGGKEVTAADVLPSAENQTLYAHWEEFMPQSVSLSYDAIRMEEGSTKKLMCNLSPSETQTPVTWKNSDETVATVSDGVVTAVGPGTATITVMTGEVPLSASCVVTVFSNDVKNDEEVIGGGSFEIPDGIWLAGFDEEKVYTGSKITQPDLRVYFGSTLLRAGIDYSVSYKNNLNAGEAVMTVLGKGNYSGKITRTFTIEPKTLFTNEEGKPLKDDVDIAVGVTNKGKPVKPAVTVTHGGKVLKQDKDYTLEYDEITEPGSEYVIIRGKGNYQGFKGEEFVVKDAPAINISKAAVTGLKKSYTLDELADENIDQILSGISLTYKNEPVSEDEYDKPKFENINAVGKGTLVITPSKDGRFTGSKRVTFNITGNRLGSIVLSEKSFVYNGTRQKPEIQVYSGKKGEGEYIGTDYYSVSYSSDCVKPGTITVTVTGRAGYTGKLTAKYSIKPLPVSEAISEGIMTVTVPSSVTYVQSGVSPVPLVTFTDGSGKEWTLKQDVDYTVKYANNKSAEGAKDPSIIITGKGSFTGKSEAIFFTINKRNISSLAVSCRDVAANSKKKGSYYYSKPVITDVNGKALREKTDYTVTYTKASGREIGKNEVISAGTVLKAVITAKGKNYCGTTTVIYKVTGQLKDIAQAAVSKTVKRMYTGKPVEIDPDDEDFGLYFTATSGSSKITKELEEGRDYVITGYYNNIKKGTASMRVEGRGEYSGSKIITFKIVSSSF